MEMESRPCKQCGKTLNLSVGRKDRQFCDELCKNKYHNTHSYLQDKETRRIVKIMKKNRQILQKMALRKDADSIPREKLLKAGFDFDYHTHFKVSKIKGYQYTFCFDYGYRVVENGRNKEIYKVVKGFVQKDSFGGERED